MTRFVIDPPTLVRLVAQSVTLPASHHLVAPNSLRTRALGILLTQVRDGALDERDALVLHERMTALKVRLLGDRVSRRTAWDLAIAHGWDDLADAEYVAVTQLQADKLVAGDTRLAELATALVAGDTRLAELATALVVVASFDELTLA